MHHIEITHNPFIVETRFVINGQPPAEGCRLASYKESRLQVWVERLFDELNELFNGDAEFLVTFTGVESDFLDIVDAADAARTRGMQISLEFEEAQAAELRLKQMRKLMAKAHKHPEFGAYLSQDDEMRRSFEEAFDSDFDVYVVATMSSGKSTLINAMLGRDLLPAANEATTATITRVFDDKSRAGSFRGKRIDNDEEVVAIHEDLTLETVTEWNKLDDTQRIDIEGDILAIQKRDNVRLVLTDTPGPNNSQDEEHERVTMGFVQDSRRNPLILYVLNATQLATNDDRNLLGLVAEAMEKGGKQSKDRFIFVVNKMDAFDPEKEDLGKVLADVRKYLEANGIQNPMVYPICANLARLIRKPSDRHSRKERSDYISMADVFSEVPSMNLLQYMPLTQRVDRALKEKGYTQLLLSSGLPAVETMIDEYIDKYNLPHRVKRVYDALNKAIDVALNETHVIAQLDQAEQDLARINDELRDLQARRKKGFDASAYKDKVEREGKVLPEATEQALTKLQSYNETFIRSIADKFTGSLAQDKAERKAAEAEGDLRFHFKTLVNKYESVFEESQLAVREDLTAEYQRYVIDLFEESRGLDLPILEGIRKSVADMSLNLKVEQKDVKTRSVVIGTKQVSTSKWYKPWTWGDKETVNVYGDEKFVDLADLWKERQTLVRREFSSLVNSARARIESGKDNLVDQFLAFMEQEFDAKFDALLSSIDDKVNDKKARERALKEAKALRNWIIAFKRDLDDTLSV
jgi:ribosome biogenesis GTPase A